MHENDRLPDRSHLKKLYDKNYSNLDNTLIELSNKLRSLLKMEGLSFTIKYRVKSFESYFNKLISLLREKNTDHAYKSIYDILGIRIICPFISDIEKAEMIVGKNFKIVEAEKKGFQHTFKEFGYQSIHFIIKMENQQRVQENNFSPQVCEIQISTTLQDAWAEVEHELVYKSALTPFDAPLKRKLAALNATLTLSDIIFQEIRDYHKSVQDYTVMRRDNIYEKLTDIVTEHSETAKGTENLPGMNEKGEIDTIDNKLLRALAAHNSGDYKTSIEIYTQLLKVEEKNQIRSLIYNHRGLAYMACSNYKNAVADFLKAVDIDDTNYRSYNHLAICKRMQGDYESSLKYLDISISINPYQSENHYFRALLFFDLGDYYRANEFCEKALNFKPDSKIFMRFKRLISKKLE